MGNTDLISALLILGVTAVAYQQSQEFSYYGRIFVNWVLLIMSGLSVILLIKGLVHKGRLAFWSTGSQKGQVFLVIIGLVSYLGLMPWAGFLLTSIIGFTSLCLLLTPAKKRKDLQTWLKAIGVATTVTIAFYGGFKYLLAVPLPIGGWLS